MEPNNTMDHNALHSYTEGTFESLQSFHAGSTTKTRFLSTLYQFLKHKGDVHVFSKVPMLGGNFLDFFDLYRTTEKHGGYEGVTKRNMWGTIAMELNILTYMSGSCHPLRRWYETFLRSFEEVIRMKVAKHQSEKIAAAKAAIARASGGPPSSLPSSSSVPTPSPLVAKAKTTLPQPPQQQQRSQQPQPPAKRPRVDPPPASTTSAALASSQPSSAPFVAKHDSKRVPERVTIDKPSVDSAIKNIRSNRLGDVVKGLNYLNQASMEPDQIQLNANRSPFYIDTGGGTWGAVRVPQSLCEHFVSFHGLHNHPFGPK